jgi:SAM-dependent methyltransferase
LFIQSEPALASGRVLHFAPERALSPILSDLATEYVTTDLVQTADVQADITELPFPDDRWDTVFCSHVLEHVPDDAKAMRELRRVVAVDGYAVVLVPRNPGTPTDEDPTVSDPLERERRFGQRDHVRMYGDDLEARLNAAGFTKIRSLSPDAYSATEIERYRLRTINGGASEVVFVCQ